MSNNNNTPKQKLSVKKAATEPTMSSKVMTVETLVAQGVDEEMAKIMIGAMSKNQSKIDEKIKVAEEFEEWKKTSGYGKALAKIVKAEEKLELLKQELPAIPEIYKSKSRGAIGGEKITATWKGEGRSKHDAAGLKKQNLKDAKWVLNSGKNIACGNGDGSDGTVETKFSKLFEHMKSVEGKIEDKDFAKELAEVKPSTYSKGCRFMCRTKERMEKHMNGECKFTPKE